MTIPQQEERRPGPSMPFSSISSSSLPPTATTTITGSSSCSNLLHRIFTRQRIRVLKKMGTGVLVASLPVAIWWKWSVDQRHHRAEEVQSKVRLPDNLQSIDELWLEQCRPGDVVLFDRRWEHCATGPLAALVCMLGRAFLCHQDPTKVLSDGKFDHCGTYASQARLP
jgi:hypothetical protein